MTISRQFFPKETVWRSVAKAVSWRIIGTIDTFVLAIIVIKYLGPMFGMSYHDTNIDIATTAGYIAAAETITKVIIYSTHERIWARLGWGVILIDGTRRETYGRSAMKMATWRVLASLDTMLLSWLFTDNIMTAFFIGGLEISTKLVLYFIHERAWQKLQFGVE